MERYGKRMEATKKAKKICLLPRSRCRCLQLLLQLPFFILFALACLERPTPNVSNYMAFVFGVNFFLSLFYLSPLFLPFLLLTKPKHRIISRVKVFFGLWGLFVELSQWSPLAA